MKKYNLSDILIKDAVIQAVKHYGIEGTEQTIKKVYSQHPKIEKAMLKAWNEIYKYKEK